MFDDRSGDPDHRDPADRNESEPVPLQGTRPIDPERACARFRASLWLGLAADARRRAA